MSDKQDEIRARYEAAMGCKNSDNLTETGKKIFAALADIPYLLGELKRVTGAVETSTEKAISDKASEKQYREALWREFDTGLHLSRYSDANAETSDDMKAVRARYEAAMKARQFKLSFDTVGASSRDVDFALADIPRLLGEVERLKEGKFTVAEFQNLCHGLPDTCTAEVFCDGCEQYQKQLFGESPISALRTRLAEKEKEVERLKDDNSDLLRDLEDAQAGCIHCGGTGLVEIASEPVPCQCPDGVVLSLRAQLIERDAEVERLEGILQSATETFTAAQLGKESQIESLSTENERLREALKPFADVGIVFIKKDDRDESQWTEIPDDRFIPMGWSHLSVTVGDLRRAGEAMEGK